MMIEKNVLIQSIVYWVWFKIVFLSFVLPALGLSEKCKKTVSAVQGGQKQQKFPSQEIHLFRNTAYRKLPNINEEEGRKIVETAKGVFVYNDYTGGIEENNILKRVINLRLRLAVVPQISFFIIHHRKSEEDVMSLSSHIQAPVRLVYWSRIGNKNKNQDFVNHFQRALEQDVHTIFVIVKSDFKKILSFLDSSVSASIIDNTNGVYLPLVQLFSKKDQVDFFDFLENVRQSSFVLSVFLTQFSPSWEKRDRVYVARIPSPPVSNKPKYSYLEVIQVLRDHDIHFWTGYHKLRTQDKLPKALPNSPEVYYKEEWQGENAFFGRKEKYTYEEAMVIMKEYGIHTLTNYHFIRRNLNSLPKVLPVDPKREYGRKWNYHEFFNRPKTPLGMEY